MSEKLIYRSLSIRSLARKVGISPTTVIRFRRGEEMDMPTARKLLPFVDTCPCCGKPTSLKGQIHE